MRADLSGPALGRPAPRPGEGSAYWRFYARVAAEQVAAWAGEEPSRILDLSPDPGLAAQLAHAGHRVVRRPGGQPPAGRGRVLAVHADMGELSWVREAALDGVLAEAGSPGGWVAAEVTAERLHQVLRPGGRLLLVVDSMLLGLAELADQQRWAELADAPAADVLLVPAPDGRLTRCFRPDELTDLLGEAGFDIDWVRPRTVLAPSAVEQALSDGGDAALRALVRTELALSAEREGESAGIHLVVSARRGR